MKNQRYFPAIILIGFGSYFLLQQMQIQVFQSFYSWPTLLMIVGIAFLFQAYGAKEYEAILPGIILTGFGFHFHIINHLSIWPDHIGSFILIISLAFLLKYLKTGSGLLQGLLFLALASLMLFYDQVLEWFGLLQNEASSVWQFWPIILIGAGLFLILKNK